MRSVLLLRGINVGGHGKLPMAELRALLEGLGAREVQTYIQSGNVVLAQAPKAEEIAGAIEAAHGFRPECLVIAAEEFRAALEADTFQEARAEPKLLHYFFCARQPAADMLAVEQALDNGERAELAGRVLYFHAPNGMGKSKFPAKVERLLGTPATARNFSTVAKLAEMLDAP
ncbi:DUF1697 domain-containing protein [Oceanicola sp. 502str15]|uniref:DUF1697 domain-containing protein n=1 Tax=Oceanicola sp. 502str15 TaxID=2696061 RepID=UPI002094CD1F|nr:DUF1697 domain-containing protein [Oceanicola sp. 502str15]MCO6383702.1 DUF1697 domain-containing protein [Oceanicola sp. 502str15]